MVKNILFLLIVTTSLFCESMNDEQERILGVWNNNPLAIQGRRSKEFTWGAGEYIPQRSIMIDFNIAGLNKDKVLQFQSGMTNYTITSIDKKCENTLQIYLYDESRYIKSNILIHILDKNRIWFETEEQNKNPNDTSELEFSYGDRAYDMGDVFTATGSNLL